MYLSALQNPVCSNCTCSRPLWLQARSHPSWWCLWCAATTMALLASSGGLICRSAHMQNTLVRTCTGQTSRDYSGMPCSALLPTRQSTSPTTQPWHAHHREPERINVMLSRARNGLVMIGNSQTLENASSAEARKHWSVVRDSGFGREGAGTRCSRVMDGRVQMETFSSHTAVLC